MDALFQCTMSLFSNRIFALNYSFTSYILIYGRATYPNGNVSGTNLVCGSVKDGMITVTPTGGVAPHACR